MNRKKAQLTAICVLFSLALAGHLARKIAAAESAAQQPHRAEIVGTTAPMSERLGADDNPAFVIHFTGDTHGSLEDCGCSGGGFGGLMRRVTYTDALKQKFPGVPMLLVDSGGLFADDRAPHGFMRIDSAVKNDWVIKAHSDYHVDAVNLSATDWRYIAHLLRTGEWEAKKTSQPALTRLVSANVTSDQASVNLPPFLIKEISLPKQSAVARVAFIGLTETGINLPPGFTASDPIAAAKQAVAKVRQSPDVVIDVIIILSHLPADAAIQLAREVSGVNVIINGTGDTVNMFMPPKKFGDTLLEFTPYETRFLGELRFYRDAQGKLTARDRYISLDDNVKQDAVAAKLAAEATDAKNGAFKEMQKLLSDWQAQAAQASRTVANNKPASTETAGYIGAQACATCHADAYLKWTNTKHAHMSDSVLLHKTEFDSSCLQCHGSLRPQPAAPLTKDNLPRFASLQCEACHGQGSQHALKPMKGYGKVGDLKTACLSCHTPQTSPKFDAQAAWQKIKH